MCRGIEKAVNKEACGVDFEMWEEGRFDENEQKVIKFEEAIYKYMQSNVALVNIYMKEPFCTKILQDVNITWYDYDFICFFSIIFRISFVGNIGGILGLCLGCSLITMMEIVWFCLGPCMDKWGCRK